MPRAPDTSTLLAAPLQGGAPADSSAASAGVEDPAGRARYTPESPAELEAGADSTSSQRLVCCPAARERLLVRSGRTVDEPCALALVLAVTLLSPFMLVMLVPFEGKLQGSFPSNCSFVFNQTAQHVIDELIAQRPEQREAKVYQDGALTLEKGTVLQLLRDADTSFSFEGRLGAGPAT